MYTSFNYQTKKALKADCDELQQLSILQIQTDVFRAKHDGQAQWSEDQQVRLNSLKNRLSIYQPNNDLAGTDISKIYQCCLEGPHYPQPHKWYASAQIKDGVVVVKVN